MKNDEKLKFVIDMLIELDKRFDILKEYVKKSGNPFLIGYCNGMTDYLKDKLKELEK